MPIGQVIVNRHIDGYANNTVIDPAERPEEIIYTDWPLVMCGEREGFLKCDIATSDKLTYKKNAVVMESYLVSLSEGNPHIFYLSVNPKCYSADMITGCTELALFESTWLLRPPETACKNKEHAVVIRFDDTLYEWFRKNNIDIKIRRRDSTNLRRCLENAVGRTETDNLETFVMTQRLRGDNVILRSANYSLADLFFGEACIFMERGVDGSYRCYDQHRPVVSPAASYVVGITEENFMKLAEPVEKKLLVFSDGLTS